MKSKVSLNTKIFVDVATHEKIRPDIFFFAFPSSRFPFESVFFHRFLILLFFFSFFPLNRLRMKPRKRLLPI